MIPVIPGLVLRLVVRELDRRGLWPVGKYLKDIVKALKEGDLDKALRIYTMLQAKPKHHEAVSEARELILFEVDMLWQEATRVEDELGGRRLAIQRNLRKLQGNLERAEEELDQLQKALRPPWWRLLFWQEQLAQIIPRFRSPLAALRMRKRAVISELSANKQALENVQAQERGVLEELAEAQAALDTLERLRAQL